jgi:hypothetical protein
MSDERTGQKPDRAGDDVQKEVARGAVQFFERGAELHQGHHVETNVDQPAVQEHSGDQAIPLMLNVYCIGRAHPKAVSRLATYSPQNAETTAATLRRNGHPLDSEHYQVRNQERGGDWRGAGENSRQAAIYRGHGKFQIGAAIVAAGGIDSH